MGLYGTTRDGMDSGATSYVPIRPRLAPSSTPASGGEFQPNQQMSMAGPMFTPDRSQSGAETLARTAPSSVTADTYGGYRGNVPGGGMAMPPPRQNAVQAQMAQNPAPQGPPIDLKDPRNAALAGYMNG